MNKGDLEESNRLFQIFRLLIPRIGDSDHFPVSLGECHFSQNDAQLFVCPTKMAPPGEIEKVEDWTDYIYVGNNTEEVPAAVLLLSPPEYHDHKFGYALTVGGMIVKLPADEIKTLVREPWGLEPLGLHTISTTNDIARMRARVKVFVPKSLRDDY